MVYVEGTIVDMELSILDLTGGIRGLEANECEWALVILLSEKFKRLDFTVLLEEVSKVFLCCFREEVLDIQVTSLL